MKMLMMMNMMMIIMMNDGVVLRHADEDDGRQLFDVSMILVHVPYLGIRGLKASL